MEVRVRWSERGGIDLEATRIDLERLASLVRDVSGTVRVPLLTSGDPSPYDRFLEHFEVTALPSGLGRFEKRGDALFLSGARANLQSIASSIASVARQEQKSSIRPHAHIEHYSGHPVLSPESEPVVVSRAV